VSSVGSFFSYVNDARSHDLERRVKGNKAYYANAKLIKSKFLKRNTKMKIY